MSKENTRKRKSSKAEKQKRKIIVTVGLAVVLVVLIIIAVFVFGNFNAYDADTNTVYVLENGKVVSASVESFDEDVYSKDEMEDYVADIINTYNEENGEDSVKQKSFDVKDDVATLIMEYADADVFEDFEGKELFVGTLAEAVAAGYTFDGEFAKVLGGEVEECGSDAFMNDSEYKVVIIKANTKVSIEGEIHYLSTENIAEIGENWVVTKDGANLFSHAENGTEYVEGTTELTTEPAEVEGADGSISEDELILGTEEETITFDFGEEEVEGSQYSEVYTYIIYK